MDKMYYNDTDTVHVIISGPPSTPINLAVIDSSSQQKLATVVQLDPNGTGIFSFNLTSFTDGIYYAMVGQGYDRVKIGFGVGLFPAGPTFVLSTPKFNFVDGEIIPISGHTLRNSLVNIFLVDNYGNIENSTRVTSDYTGSFYANLGIPSHVIGGGWYLFAKSEEGTWTSEIMINTHGVSTMTLHIPSGLSPLKQFKLGISTENMQCHQGFQLILKAEDGSPACVKSETAQKLIERGWASEIVQPKVTESMKTTQLDPCSSQLVNQTIMPGQLHLPACPPLLFNTNTNVIAKTGFVGVYNYTNIVDDYVIEAGHNGIITYTIVANHPKYSGSVSNQEIPHQLNFTNYATFFHEKTIPLADIGKYPKINKESGSLPPAYSTCYAIPDSNEQACNGAQPTGGSVSLYFYDHPGVNVSFDKKSEMIGQNGSDIVTMKISVSHDAPTGTYLVEVSPGICMGGELFLLTVGDCHYGGVK